MGSEYRSFWMVVGDAATSNVGWQYETRGMVLQSFKFYSIFIYILIEFLPSFLGWGAEGVTGKQRGRKTF